MSLFLKEKDTSYTLARNTLLKDIAKTKTDLDVAYRNFECATDPDLIDCYIYEVNAAQKRYKFLLECMRRLSEETA